MNNNLYISIVDKIVEIKNNILHNMTSMQLSDKTRGLMDDDFGILLFLHNYAKVMNDDEVARFAYKYTEHIINTLSNTVSNSYCDGWAGALLCFDYLRDDNFVDINIDDIIDMVETSIYHYTVFCISNNVYEFLYGVSGVGLYWLSRDNHKMIDYIVSSLHKAKETDIESTGYKWNMKNMNVTDSPDYNLSMSHGLVGMLLFLTRVFEKYGDIKAEEMIVGGINYLLAQRNVRTDSISIFPSVANNNNINTQQSRLGWCYGDLGCAYLLYEASIIFKREDWRKTAMEIYKHASHRRTPSTTMVVDAGLCHGTAGIAMLFQDIAIKSKDVIFEECVNFWMAETIKMAKFEDGVAGYKTVFLNDTRLDYSLITGVSGIGLMMLWYIDNKYTWKNLFLP